MKIWEIPFDLLDLILQFDASFCAIELWKCGNKRLQTRLALGGVTSMKLQDRNRRTLSRWPKILSSFHKMRHLSITRLHSRLDSPDIIRKQLCLLGPQLESLELAIQDLQDVILPSDNISILLQHIFDESQHSCVMPISLENTLDPCPYDGPPMWDMRCHFPNLQSLKLQFTYDRHGRNQMFDLTLLPPNLTLLSIKGVRPWTLSPTFAKSLPRTLSLLHVGSGTTYLSTCACAYLPPSLTELTGAIEVEMGAILPSTLLVIDHAAKLRLDSISASHNLQSLVVREGIPDLTVKQISLLSHSLTLFSCPRIDVISPVELIRALPHTLSTLMLPRVDDWSEIYEMDFPRALTSLRISNSPKFAASDMFRLPSTLLVLAMGSLNGAVTHAALNSIVSLPPRLTKLNMMRPDHLPALYHALNVTQWRVFCVPELESLKEAEQIFQLLPPVLRCLSLVFTPGAHAIDIGPVLVERLGQLRYLTNLNVTRGRIASFHFGVLPRTLTELSCGGDSAKFYETLPEHLWQLPPNLRRFHGSLRWDFPSLARRFINNTLQSMNLMLPDSQNRIPEAIDLLLACDNLPAEEKAAIEYFAKILKRPTAHSDLDARPDSTHYPFFIKLLPNWLKIIPRTIIYLLCQTLPVLGQDLLDLPPLIHAPIIHVHYLRRAHLKGIRKILGTAFSIVSYDPEDDEKIKDQDFPICSNYEWGIYQMKESLSKWHSYNNLPIITPDPRISERYRTDL